MFNEQQTHEFIHQLSRIADALERAYPAGPEDADSNEEAGPNPKAWKAYSEYTRGTKQKL